MPETNHPPEFHGGSFPLMIDLAGKTVLVVGGGAVAARKIRTLVSFGARVRVVSPRSRPTSPANRWNILRANGARRIWAARYSPSPPPTGAK